MKKFSAADRIFEFLLLVVTACFGAAGILGFAVSFQFRSAALPMFACGAAMILLPFFFPKAAKIAEWILLAAAAAGAVWIFFFSGSNSVFAEQYGSFSGFLAQLDGKILLCAAAAALSEILFLSRDSRLGIVLVWTACTGIPAALSLSGWKTSLPALLAATGCCALLFIRCSVRPAFEGIRNGPKLSLRVTAFSAALLTVILAVTQFAFTGLSARFGSTEKISIRGLETWARSFAAVQSGFGDYDPYRPLGVSVSQSSRLVMEVQSDGPFYLRGRIYDQYAGSSWRAAQTEDENDVYHTSSLGTISFDDLKDGYYYIKKNREVLSGSVIVSHSLRVTTKTTGLQKYLFLPLSTAQPPETMSGMIPEMKRTYPDFAASQPLPENTSYQVDYWVPNPALVSLMANDKYYPSVSRDLAPIQAAYGSADGLTDRTLELAQGITEGCTNEFQKAAAIRRWLAENCSYSLSPPQPGYGQDFVDFFLFESRQGYCQHFATAMVMLLRASGVPARYVEGYAAPSVSAGGVYEVTDAQAHAWVEYRSPIFGFVTDDPTPAGDLPAPALAAGNSGAESSPASSAPASALSESSVSEAGFLSEADSIPSAAESQADFSSGGDRYGRYPDWRFFAAAVLLIFALWGGKALWRALWFARLKRADSKVFARKLYAYFVRAFALLGFGIPRSGTAEELADRVRGKMEFGAVSFDRVTQLCEKARFGASGLTESETDELIGFYRSFPAACRRKLGTFRCLIFYPALH